MRAVKRLLVAAFFIAAVAAVSLSTPSRAQSGSAWQAVEEAANQEGEVVYYAVDLQDRVKAIAEAFAKQYPKIRIVTQRGNSMEVNTRLAAEERANAPTADVVGSVDLALLAQWSREGRLVPIRGPVYADLKNTIFKEYPDLAPGNDRAVYSGVAYEIAWNTSLVKKPITSYADLVSRADEFGNGRLAAPNWLGPGTGLFYTQIEERTSKVDLAKDLQAGDWLQKFAALKPKLFNSGSPIAQAVASGEVAAGIYAPTPAILPLKAKGAPIERLLSKDVPTSNNFMGVILKRGTHPNAAQVLVNFLLSEEGQKVAAFGGAITIRPNVPGSSGGPELFNVPRDAIISSDYMDRFRARWQAIMGQ